MNQSIDPKSQGAYAQTATPAGTITTPGGAGYKVKRAQRFIGQSALHRELVHLLKRPMALTPRGVVDAGAMCRDSAVLLAMLVTLLGLPAEICEGQAAIFGLTSTQMLGQLYFETHAWLHVKDFGLCDFSPDLSPGGGPGWSALPAQYLCGSRYKPHGQSDFDYVVGDEARFTGLVDHQLSSPPAFRSIYLEQRRRPFDHFLLAASADFAQSTLLESLRWKRYFDPDILIKAGLHLWRFPHHEEPSLTTVPQEQAWDTIGVTAAAAVRDFKLKLARKLDAVWHR